MTLEVDNVELSFNNKTILNGIYLKAEKGQITSLIGRNGSGKSCLLQIIFGSLKPKYKLIRIDKKPFLKPLYRYQKKIAFLPQHQISNNRLKIKCVFRLFNVSLAEFLSDFDNFRKFKNSRIKELSFGEIRILETYLILKSKREIVLLDEPFSYLAPLMVSKLKKILLQEKNHKIILISDHRYEDVLDISDTNYFLNQGNTQMVSNMEDLKNLKYISNIKRFEIEALYI